MSAPSQLTDFGDHDDHARTPTSFGGVRVVDRRPGARVTRPSRNNGADGVIAVPASVRRPPRRPVRADSRSQFLDELAAAKESASAARYELTTAREDAAQAKRGQALLDDALDSARKHADELEERCKTYEATVASLQVRLPLFWLVVRVAAMRGSALSPARCQAHALRPDDSFCRPNRPLWRSTRRTPSPLAFWPY